MTRKTWTLLLAGLFALAAPGLAAAPFGHFGGIIGGANAGGGFLPLHGWALDDGGIARVEIWVDGQPAGTAYYGFARPDVQAMYPGYPDSPTAGFGFELNSALWLNGMHTITAVMVSKSGERVTYGQQYSILFTNTTHTLVPFGAIDFPHSSAQMFGNCDLSDPVRRYSVVTGYALDTGIELGDTGVKWVELLINGAVYANTVTDSFYSDATGGWSNFFGLPRPEIKTRYPSIPNAFNSGYRFVLDIGVLVALGFDQGFHELTVRVGDYSGQVANIAEIPVVFLCDYAVGAEGSVGGISFPVPNGIYGGSAITFTGWALDWQGIDRVRIFVDGLELGDATYGLVYPGLNLYYPGYPDTPAGGWSFTWDATRYADGVHTLQVVARDELGADTVIGEVTFLTDSYFGGGGGH